MAKAVRPETSAAGSPDSRRMEWLGIGGIAASVLIIDQLTKLAAIEWLRSEPPLAVIPGFFQLVFVQNTGAAWGMFAGGQLFLIAFSLLVIAFLSWRRRDIFGGDRLGLFTFGLLMGGILGNLIDRIRINAVIDFLDFHWGTSHFPAFNIADSAICIATFLLSLSQSVRKRP